MVEVWDHRGSQEEEVLFDQDRQWTGLLAQPEVFKADPCSVHLALNHFSPDFNINFADAFNVDTTGHSLANPSSAEEIFASTSSAGEVLLNPISWYSLRFQFQERRLQFFCIFQICCLCILLIRSPLISTFSFHCPKSNPTAYAGFPFFPCHLAYVHSRTMTPGLSLSLNSNLVYLNLEKEKEKGELMDSDSFLLR